VETEELKILLALEPAWTVSLNGFEFQTIHASDIAVDSTVIRLGKWTRRIDSVEWLRPNIVRIRGRQRFRSTIDSLTLYPGEHLPSPVNLRRRRRSFQSQLGPVLGQYFGTRWTGKQILHSDRIRGIGGAYPRFMIGGRPVITVDPDEASPTINGIMRAVLLWSPLVRSRITVIVPKHRSATIASRLAVMPVMKQRFVWLEWDGENIAPFSSVTRDTSETEVHPFVQLNVDLEVARILSSCPFPLEPVLNIAGRAVSIRFRGIEVVQVREGTTTYSFGEPLEKVVAELAAVRRHGGPHPLARAHEERWLESNLIGQIGRLLPSVNPKHIYPQVPSFIGEQRNIIDLLTVTKEGRLVVMEIKASADPDLPFQAMDYWIAVERHRKSKDFESKGYFSGISLKNEPALLVLVAPMLAYHKTFRHMISVFPRELPLLEVGLNQTWKKEIKILRRQGLVS